MKIHVLPKNVIVIQHTSQKSLLSLHFKIPLFTERGKKEIRTENRPKKNPLILNLIHKKRTLMI